MSAAKVIHGDCIEVMRTMAENSVDSIVTDPPYGLGFMGKKWDDLPPGKEWAEECLRVLKPGGHLLAFGGTRTWHRLAVAVEDAGFEIRDSIFWHYGSGFPKSHNVSTSLDGKRCSCAVPLNHEDVSRQDLRSVQPDVATTEPLPIDAEQDVLKGLRQPTIERGEEGQASTQRSANNDPLRRMRGTREDPAGMGQEEREDVLLTAMQRSGTRQGMGDLRAQGRESKEDLHGNDGRGQPGMEGRGDAGEGQGQLHRPALRPMPARVEGDGPQRRVHHGASPSNGSMGGAPVTEDGSGEPHQPKPEGQQAGKPRAVPIERGSQARGSWPICGGCSKPVIPDGLGTALKPATEPVVMARKPLAGKTVAANVLEYGTGALNIDASRIGWADIGERDLIQRRSGRPTVSDGWGLTPEDADREKTHASGRWPANVILDEGMAEVLDEQSGTTPSNFRANKGLQSTGQHGGRAGAQALLKAGTDGPRGIDDSGGASRFFYVAKAPKRERPIVDGIAHPTVKPLTLMRHLVKLVTPVGGTVLEPFAGSGATVEACLLEGFDVIAIEREAEYLPLIEARIERTTAA